MSPEPFHAHTVQGTDAHTPVLAREVVEALTLEPRAVVVDGTAGSGGHTEALLQGMSRHPKEGIILAIDADPQAVELLAARFRNAPSVRVRHANYAGLRDTLDSEGIRTADAVLLDLGLSSRQLAVPGRGFSFAADDPLDMRFDQTAGGPTAADLLNSCAEEELAEILREHGEERHARRIARAIVRDRRESRIDTTRHLADLIENAIGGRREKIHPATRAFQALRIAVNRELENLKNFLDRLPECLGPRGRVCIISYHSLEDRIVKHGLKRLAQTQILEIVTRKPIRPTADEVDGNPRARSAKLRVAQKAEEPPPQTGPKMWR